MFDYVVIYDELMLYCRALELINRVKELSLQHEGILKHMGVLESIHKCFITNNLNNALLLKIMRSGLALPRHL